ncbi:ROK family glucokinase [Aerococcaceae bacterium WGS1372]
MKKHIIAIDLGGTSAKLALMDLEGQILEKWSVVTDKNNKGQVIVPNLINSIQEKLIDFNLTTNDILGIGMGSPGSVNHIDKTVIGAYNLNWTEKQLIGKAFEEAFSIPFYIENDANIAAMGEQWKGAGNNDKDVVMVTLGTGVGGGIVVEGELLHGSTGTAGEIGHITVDPDSMIECTCGKRGCLEAVASATGIVNLAIHYLANYDGETALKDLLQEEDVLSSKDIFSYAAKGDELSSFIVDKFCKYLGLAVSHLANTLNPSKIVLGGGVSQAGEVLRSKVDQYSKEFMFPTIRPVTEIVIAKLGNDAGVYGACKVVLNEQSKEELVG